MPKFKPGDRITAITPISEGIRRVTLLEVTKVGRKYIHGITLYYTPEGDIEKGHQVRMNMMDSVIYPALRRDLWSAEFKHRADYQKWIQEKLKEDRRLNSELQRTLSQKLRQWEEDHPMPRRAELPTPEEG